MQLSAPIRVLVVDDSAFMRKAISEMLTTSAFIEVIGTARDGQDALEKVEELRPDVVTLDLYMPRLDGLGFLRAQMARRKVPVVLCTSAGDDVQLALAAIEAGALEFVQKPTAQALDSVRGISHFLVQAVLSAAQASLEKIPAPPEVGHTPPPPESRGAVQATRAVLIGISTGGPQALRYLMPRFPVNFPAPVAVALHMPPGYTGPFAERLSDMGPLEVVESKDGLEMKPGRIILAQAGIHTSLARQKSGSVICNLVKDTAGEHLYCPSVDVLFRSGAETYGAGAIGVVMTGMGSDGTAGAGWIKAQGGTVLAESEQSSVIYGMPSSVVKAGLVDRIVPLNQIVDTLLEILT